MVREQLERILQSVQVGDWLGSVSSEVRRDLADDAHLSDLVSGDPDDDATVAFLRSSRLPRLRPVLVVLAARASGGGEVDPELQYAAELLYAALAVHDVAIGPRHNKRRTIARKVLRGVGRLGGNGVLLRAMELARHAPSPEILGELVETLTAVHEGDEIAASVRLGGVPTVQLWKDHADGHTGALLAFCCRAGAHVSGCSEGQLAAFGRYGRHLGRIWHVAEDAVLLQDEHAVEYLVGRALAGRPMLPVAIAAERDPEVATLWRRIIDAHDAEAAEALLGRLKSTNAVRGTREYVVAEHWGARQALARFEATPYRRALERLVSGLSRAPYEDAERAIEAYPTDPED